MKQSNYSKVGLKRANFSILPYYSALLFSSMSLDKLINPDYCLFV